MFLAVVWVTNSLRRPNSVLSKGWFPAEGQAHDVHALGPVIVHLALIRVGVMRPKDTRQVVFAEIGAGQADAF
jgi:hypothetical protein